MAVGSTAFAPESLESRRLFAVSAGFAEAEFASGLTQPTAMAFAPDGRLLVAEQDGALRVIRDGALQQEPAIDLPVRSEGERGLIGLALDPAFEQNGLVYLHYTTASPVIHNRVSRFMMAGDTTDSSSEQVLIELPPLTAATNHNGGAIHFGVDGKLYIAVGDNNDPSNAQPLTTVLGKMLRINPDGSIPDDNPFLDQTSGQNQAIWARGLRNPYTFAIGSQGQTHINDVGQSAFEEINVGIASGNYGWPITEGRRKPDDDVPADYVDPLLAYGRDGGPVSGSSIAGGVFYEPASGSTSPFPDDFQGDYLFADWGAGFVKSIDPATAVVAPVASGLSGPVDLDVGPDGNVYVLEYFAGRVTRLSAAAPDLAVSLTSELPAAAVQGGRDKVSVRVDNAGVVAVNGKVAVRLLASADDVVDGSDLVLKELSARARLQPGDGKRLSSRVIWPATLDGPVRLLAVLASADGRITETDLANNLAASPAAVRVAPPFVDLSPAFPDQPILFDTSARRQTLELTLLNQGNRRYTGGVEIELTALSPAAGEPALVDTFRRPLSIGRSTSAPVRLRFSLPPTLAQGTYDLRAIVRIRGPLVDGDPANDSATHPAEVA